MKKFILTGMAVAMLAIPAVASADVPRHQTQTRHADGHAA